MYAWRVSKLYLYFMHQSEVKDMTGDTSIHVPIGFVFYNSHRAIENDGGDKN